MRRIPIVTLCLLFILILSACNNDVYEKQPEKSVEDIPGISENNGGKAQILEVSTDLEKENGWSIVPKGVRTMTISAEVENVETVLFWITPTGTATWGERTLIGIDIDGDDGWSFEWEFGDRKFHDHITVQALGSDSATQAQETLNVHSVDENGE
ncbi:hypothetical protein [Saccharococcus sp. Marseille-Q5394]|uniref:hypothetical protein n=1 Tax=Saccharococcus sp. Marseille-Q5394 TaxID=2972778 RepID=UPI0021CA69CE|nr:hypothetical protein [Saccharococcus sp. Marseille-Q5394]